jgi:hypothetical protein
MNCGDSGGGLLEMAGNKSFVLLTRYRRVGTIQTAGVSGGVGGFETPEAEIPLLADSAGHVHE